jgi:hypothetical protein
VNTDFGPDRTLMLNSQMEAHMSEKPSCLRQFLCALSEMMPWGRFDEISFGRNLRIKRKKGKM